MVVASGRDAVREASRWNGHSEKRVNRTRFNDVFYGRKVSGSAFPWCAAFTSVVYRTVGLRPNVDFPWSAGVAACFAWYRRKGRIVNKRRLREGDQVRYTFSHTGIFSHYDRRGNAVVWEGNTSGNSRGSQRDGGGVHKRTRPLSLIQYGGRPSWSKTSKGKVSPAKTVRGNNNSNSSSVLGVLGLTEYVYVRRDEDQVVKGKTRATIRVGAPEKKKGGHPGRYVICPARKGKMASVTVDGEIKGLAPGETVKARVCLESKGRIIYRFPHQSVTGGGYGWDTFNLVVNDRSGYDAGFRVEVDNTTGHDVVVNYVSSRVFTEK